jgi:bacteriorhodopsin
VTLSAIISALSYFAMASGQATTFNCIKVTDHHEHVPDVGHLACRQIFWARYVDWTLTFPILLLNLGLLAGIDGGHTLMAIIASVIMTLSGLFSALGKTHTAQKWGWFSIACVSYVFVLWHIVLHGSNMVKAKGSAVTKLFSSLALFSFIVWTIYPIVWGIADGGRKISVDKELMIYAILDALLKPGFGIWLLSSHRAIPETNVDLDGYWSNGLSAEGRIRVGDDE